MDRLVKKGDLSAKQHSAHEFTSLVFLLRKMDQKRMKPIWTKYFESEDHDLRDVYRYIYYIIQRFVLVKPGFNDITTHKELS